METPLFLVQHPNIERPEFLRIQTTNREPNNFKLEIFSTQRIEELHIQSRHRKKRIEIPKNL